MKKQIFYLLFPLLLLLAACSSDSPTVDSPFGPMTTYRSDSKAFTFEVPADWTDGAGTDPRCEGMAVCLVSATDQVMTIREANLGDVGKSDGMQLNEYMDVILVDFGTYTEGYEFKTRSQVITSSGLRTEVLNYTVQDGLMTVKELWYVYEGYGITLSFAAPTDTFSAFDPLVDYLMSTLRLTGN